MPEFKTYREFCEYDAEVVEAAQRGDLPASGQVPDSFRDQWGRGRRPARFRIEYAFADLAKLCGVSVKRLRNLKALGAFDPHNFASVAALLRARQPKEEPK